MKNKITETVPFWGDLDCSTAAFLRTELGDISSLIADMACNGATETELASAINHSANVIGIMKNSIDLIKKSECENEISELRQKYQLGRRDRRRDDFDRIQRSCRYYKPAFDLDHNLIDTCLLRDHIPGINWADCNYASCPRLKNEN